jgi:hypothetical protein
MLVMTSWFLLLVGLGLFTWFFVIRGRGSLHYWIRRYEIPTQYALGQTFAIDDKQGQQQFFTDANAVVRSLDRHTNKVIRHWDTKGGRVFLGLIMSALPDDPVPDDYELREFPQRQVVRLSGTNRLEESNEVSAVRAYAEKQGLALDLDHPARLSGQSFGLYQWDVKQSDSHHTNSLIGRWAESTYQLRNNLVLPLLATWIAVTLIGTSQPLLLVLGIILICFLSGACKFVFIHQMTDEADEIHLQNY